MQIWLLSLESRCSLLLHWVQHAKEKRSEGKIKRARSGSFVMFSVQSYTGPAWPFFWTPHHRQRFVSSETEHLVSKEGKPEKSTSPLHWGRGAGRHSAPFPCAEKRLEHPRCHAGPAQEGGTESGVKGSGAVLLVTTQPKIVHSITVSKIFSAVDTSLGRGKYSLSSTKACFSLHTFSSSTIRPFSFYPSCRLVSWF